ncbi:hypothetical protein B879_00913 [Cecembia lonarensis LW9]|uniref:Uncharacterized protein n=1 Tax=Cecembia lonarensis (strain CCUG 58316 / KCTC 22772 / LW9) TaxID=1225176 RepID=K1L6Y3_CECL9|nr:hypothetical protein B879_00913 [Cecembia lonarensis LW9]
MDVKSKNHPFATLAVKKINRYGREEYRPSPCDLGGKKFKPQWTRRVKTISLRP